ncbi:MAG: SDR family NAD(P)-dependent oxidoreductase [Candidatus Hydrogenedentes bacterium]|nr:SDR family NAD(P)-dependent oxidoreductase [Candidatus Hydrogenedentota bacterium]
MPSKEAIQAWLIEHVAAELGVDRSAIKPSAAFDDLGMASRDAVTISGDLEDWLGKKLSPTLLWEYPSIAQLAAHLAGENQAAALDAPPAVGVSNEPVAIIGMGIRAPGAASVNAFWSLLTNGTDAISEVPADRWKIDDYFDANPGAPGKMYTRRGGFLDRVDTFDADFFGISPREAARMDPQQRLLMETAWEALEDAGVPPTSLAGSQTGVFVGISSSDYSSLQLGDANRVDAYAGTGNAHSLAPNRISYFLDLRGPSIAVDTACSSSLVAVHQAVTSLRKGESSLALAGGVNVILSPEVNMVFSHARMMAPDGLCKTFDASADGYVRGEGCGVVVLKRLSEAIADGDAIHAVIRGSAVNHDGRSNGITAPNQLAQQDVIRRALADAGVSHRDVGYVEAHGTGTSLGDPIEVDALKAVLLPERAANEPCVLGSVKTNIGHLEAAAGIAGLIKTALVLERGTIPAHLHLKQINPLIEIEGTPLRIATQTEQWETSKRKRVAGVSSFGFGGANAHVVLEAPPATAPKPESQAERPLHALALSAQTDDALTTLAGRYADAIDSAPLADFCYSANTGRAHLAKRVAIIAGTTGEAVNTLREFAENGSAKSAVVGEAKPNTETRLAFLFTGQGAQFPQMGRGLYEASPVFRRVMNECDEVLRPRLEVPLLKAIYPEEGSATPLDETAYTQPALFAIEYALAGLWKSWGITPSIVMGHSVGEYVAACVAGVFSFEDGLNLIAERARLMGSMPPGGTMAAVLTDRDTVAAGLVSRTGVVAIAGINGPANTVVSGPEQEVDALLAEFKERGVKSIKLNVSHAFHSPLMDPMLDAFEQFASTIAFKSPQIPVVSNLYGGVPDDANAFTANYWRNHLREAVQFLDGIKSITGLGFNTFLEVGPQATLSGMGARCVAKDAAVWLPSLAKGQDDWQVILRSLQSLYVAGAKIDWKGFDAPYVRSRISLPTYPFAKQRHWLDNSATTRKAPAPTAASAQTVSASRVSDWLYQVKWIQKNNATQPGAMPSRWLILADKSGAGDALAQRVRARGGSAIIVRAADSYEAAAADDISLDPMNGADFDRLWNEIGRTCDRIVHLWSLDAPNIDDATLQSLHHAHALGCGAMLHLVQSISESGERDGHFASRSQRLLWCVTRGAQSIEALNGGVAAAQAPLWGFGRSVALEHARLWGGLVDLDPHAGDSSADLLLRELDAPDGEDQIGFRSGRRFAARLAKNNGTTGNGKGAAIQCRPDATYVVTGGLGGLGLHVAKWLGGRGAKHVVLFGRTPLPPREEWNTVSDTAIRERIDTVVALEADGVEVRCASVDVTDEMQVRDFLAAYDRSGLPPIRGVVHAAGVIDDHAVTNLSMDSLTAVMRPKVDGTMLLHRHFDANGNGAANRLDFFVLFSSVAAVMGAPGQANYAAGNAFMDALAHHRRAHGQPALCINWGPWAETGMAARTQLVHRWAAQGIDSLQPSEGIAVLDSLMSSGESHIGVLHADWDRIGNRIPMFAESPMFSELINGHAKSPAAAAPKAPAKPAANDVEAIEAYLRRQVAQVLSRNEDSIAIDRNFGELGVDSIMMMEIVNSIERDLGVRLFPKELFDRPTIADLAPYLVHEVAQLDHRADAQPAQTTARSTAARLRPRLRRIGPAVKNKPAVFLLSAPRSGSTLLRVMLAGHPQLFSPPEFHLLQYNTMREWHNGLGTSFLGEGLPRAWMELRGFTAEQAKAHVDEYVRNDVPVEKVYADMQELVAPRLLVDKSPSYGEGADILDHAERIFDGAKYIHLVRHPYSVIESFIRNRFDRLMMDGEADPMAAGEDVWTAHNANISDFLENIDSDRKYVVKYEDIVAKPEESMKAMCAFLGIPFDPAVLTPYEGDRMTDGVHATSMHIGDPNFKKHDGIDASLGDVWKRTRLPRKLGGFARRVAAELEYPLPVEVPGSVNAEVGLSATVPHVVAIQPKGDRPPFFCCAPAGGMTFMYFHLPRYMGENQPIYGLQDPALNPAIDPLPTMELLCAEQVKAIRSIQPSGPYYIGGWSFGGAVAFETAQQLIAAGEDVAFLGIIDTEARIEKHRARTAGEWLRYLWGQLKMSVKVVGHWPPYARDFIYIILPSKLKNRKKSADEPSLWEYFSFAFADVIRHTLVKKADMAQIATRNNRVLLIKQPKTRRTVRVLKANLKALLAYKLQPYRGRITLLRAEDQSIMHKLHEDWTLGWGDLAEGGIDIVEVPGNHAVLMNPPYVEHVAKVLREGMDKAIAERGGPAPDEEA